MVGVRTFSFKSASLTGRETVLGGGGGTDVVVSAIVNACVLFDCEVRWGEDALVLDVLASIGLAQEHRVKGLTSLEILRLGAWNECVRTVTFFQWLSLALVIAAPARFVSGGFSTCPKTPGSLQGTGTLQLDGVCRLPDAAAAIRPSALVELQPAESRPSPKILGRSARDSSASHSTVAGKPGPVPAYSDRRETMSPEAHGVVSPRTPATTFGENYQS